jgi:hypothetical protein
MLKIMTIITLLTAGSVYAQNNAAPLPGEGDAPQKTIVETPPPPRPRANVQVQVAAALDDINYVNFKDCIIRVDVQTPGGVAKLRGDSRQKNGYLRDQWGVESGFFVLAGEVVPGQDFIDNPAVILVEYQNPLTGLGTMRLYERAPGYAGVLPPSEAVFSTSGHDLETFAGEIRTSTQNAMALTIRFERARTAADFLIILTRLFGHRDDPNRAGDCVGNCSGGPVVLPAQNLPPPTPYYSGQVAFTSLRRMGPCGLPLVSAVINGRQLIQEQLRDGSFVNPGQVCGRQ